MTPEQKIREEVMKEAHRGAKIMQVAKFVVEQNLPNKEEDWLFIYSLKQLGLLK